VLPSTRPGDGGHKDPPLIIPNVTNAGFAIFFALIALSSNRRTDFINLTFFTVRGAVFVLRNVPEL